MGDLCENAENMDIQMARRLRAESVKRMEEAQKKAEEAEKRMEKAQKEAEEAKKKLLESYKEILNALLEMCMSELTVRQKLKEIGISSEES